MEAISLLAHGLAIHNCNLDPHNPCNDHRYCCLHSTILSPPFGGLFGDNHVLSNDSIIHHDELLIIPYCPILLAPCDPIVTLHDLSWNRGFTISFIVTCTLVVLYCLQFIFALLILKTDNIQNTIQKIPKNTTSFGSYKPLTFYSKNYK